MSQGRHPRTRLWLVVLREARQTLWSTPMAALTPAVGTIVGVAAAVGALNVTYAAQHQVSDRFDAVAATQVVMTPTDPTHPIPLPRDVDARIDGLAGVRSGGVVDSYDQLPVGYAYSTPAANSGAASSALVTGVTNGGLQATQPVVRWSAGSAKSHQLCSGCALLGVVAARDLGLDARLGGTILVDGVPFVVAGILDDVSRATQLLESVVLNDRDIRADLRLEPSQQSIVVETQAGAAPAVGRQLPAAVAPDEAASLSVAVPPDASALRQSVGRELTDLALGLACLSMLTGIFAIGSSFSNSVWRRTPEFGLRRALGATGRDIRRQVVLEATAVGGAGGVVGALLGIFTSLTVAAASGWAPTLAVWLVIVAPLAGVLCGVAAGWLPARRAGRIEPSVALRTV